MKSLVIILLSIIVTSTHGYHNNIDGICSRNVHLTTYSNQIIDIKKSVKLGAKLLKGVEVVSHSECIKDCCSFPNCDLALYRINEEYRYRRRTSNHNCYYVHCGNFTNCVLASHEEFTSYHVTQNNHVSTTIDNGREHEGINHINNNNKVTTPTLSYKDTTKTYKAKSVTTAQLLPSSTTTVLYTTTSTDTKNIAITSTVIAKPIDTSSSNTILTSHSTTLLVVANKSPTPSLLNHATDSLINDHIESSGDHSNHDDHESPEDLSNDDDGDEPCWKSGCGHSKMRGGDIIAAVIVSMIALTFISVLSFVIVRKFYKNRQLKHYHNVDYLINGMYT